MSIIDDSVTLDELCDMLEDGMMQADICRKLGFQTSELSRWIAADPQRSVRVTEARLLSAATFADKAERVLQDADDEFPLRKAKELAHHYRWKASKMNPKSYGDRVQQDVTVNEALSDRLEAALRRVASEC